MRMFEFLQEDISQDMKNIKNIRMLNTVLDKGDKALLRQVWNASAVPIEKKEAYINMLMGQYNIEDEVEAPGTTSPEPVKGSRGRPQRATVVRPPVKGSRGRPQRATVVRPPESLNKKWRKKKGTSNKYPKWFDKAVRLKQNNPNFTLTDISRKIGKAQPAIRNWLIGPPSDKDHWAHINPPFTYDDFPPVKGRTKYSTEGPKPPWFDKAVQIKKDNPNMSAAEIGKQFQPQVSNGLLLRWLAGSGFHNDRLNYNPPFTSKDFPNRGGSSGLDSVTGKPPWYERAVKFKKDYPSTNIHQLSRIFDVHKVTLAQWLYGLKKGFDKRKPDMNLVTNPNPPFTKDDFPDVRPGDGNQVKSRPVATIGDNQPPKEEPESIDQLLRKIYKHPTSARGNGEIKKTTIDPDIGPIVRPERTGWEQSKDSSGRSNKGQGPATIGTYDAPGVDLDAFPDGQDDYGVYTSSVTDKKDGRKITQLQRRSEPLSNFDGPLAGGVDGQDDEQTKDTIHRDLDSFSDLTPDYVEDIETEYQNGANPNEIARTLSQTYGLPIASALKIVDNWVNFSTRRGSGANANAKNIRQMSRVQRNKKTGGRKFFQPKEKEDSENLNEVFKEYQMAVKKLSETSNSN